MNDFEICRYSMIGKKYEILSMSDPNKTVKDAGLKAWEKLFLRFRVDGEPFFLRPLLSLLIAL